MFVLLDNLSINLNDRPNLGCAMLMSACKINNIETVYINGAETIIKHLLTDMSKEYYDLIIERKYKIKELSSYVEKIINDTKEEFCKTLKTLYTDFYEEKSIRNYLQIDTINQIMELVRFFNIFHEECLDETELTATPIVKFYIKLIRNYNPEMVGFSMNKFDAISRAIRRVLYESRSIKIVIGGSFTPFLDKEEIEYAFRSEYLNYMIIGPGEIALPKLINKAEPLESINNLVYMENGKLYINEQTIVNDLNSLPDPDFSEFDLDCYFSPFRVLPIQSARGCSYQKCAFCSYHRNAFGTCKMYKIDKVVGQIKEMKKKYDCNHFYFHDDDFIAKRAELFCKKIIEEELEGLFFYQYARLDEEYNNKKLLDLMQQAGFSFIYWGLESGCEKILKLMNKNIKKYDMHEILKECYKRKIGNLCMMIFGFPGEDYDTISETTEFLEQNAEYIDIISVNLFDLSKFSLMYADPQKWGISIKQNGKYSCAYGLQPDENALELQKFREKIKKNEINCYNSKFRQFKDHSIYYLNRIIAIYNRYNIDEWSYYDSSIIYPIIYFNKNTNSKLEQIIIKKCNGNNSVEQIMSYINDNSVKKYSQNIVIDTIKRLVSETNGFTLKISEK